MSSDAMSTATSSGAMLRVSTNAQGPYESPGLQPGGYELRVTPPGSVPQRSRCSWARHRMRYRNSSPPAA